MDEYRYMEKQRPRQSHTVHGVQSDGFYPPPSKHQPRPQPMPIYENQPVYVSAPKYRQQKAEVGCLSLLCACCYVEGCCSADCDCSCCGKDVGYRQDDDETECEC